MISEFVEQSDGELYTGDLLEGVKEKMGVAALGAALLELFRMSGEGEVMMVEDTDSMRIKVIKNKGAELS